MVGHEHQGEEAAWDKVRMSGYISQKLVVATTDHKLQADRTGMQSGFPINRWDTAHVVDSRLCSNDNFEYKQLYTGTIFLVPKITIWNCAYNYAACNDFWNVFKVSINGASTIFSLTLSAINGMYSHILPKSKYLLSLGVKWNAICWVPHPRNERQQRVNDLDSYIVNNQRVLQWHSLIITVLATIISNNGNISIATIF
jgi:hypothetical protein